MTLLDSTKLACSHYGVRLVFWNKGDHLEPMLPKEVKIELRHFARKKKTEASLGESEHEVYSKISVFVGSRRIAGGASLFASSELGNVLVFPETGIDRFRSLVQVGVVTD